MFLKNLTLTQYRNYESQEWNLNRGINILLGENGQGKTNLLEGVYYLSVGGNFRGNKDLELIQWNHPYFRLQGQMKKNDSERYYDIDIYYDSEKNKQIKINGVKYKSITALQDYLHVVLFSPEDLKIIKGSPAERRKYLDMILCQREKTYYRLLRDYEKIVFQRNNLLKELQYKRSNIEDNNQLKVWNQQMIQYGSAIIYKRIQFLKKLIPLARKVQQDLTQQSERFTVTYHCSIGAIGDFTQQEIQTFYNRILTEKLGEELVKGTSLWGPHRDDLVFYLNGTELKKYGSQGQQRTAVLALKMAELKVFNQLNGEYPLLLLDDVMSELDDHRREFLIHMVNREKIQCIITGANMELILNQIGDTDVFIIENGTILKRS